MVKHSKLECPSYKDLQRMRSSASDQKQVTQATGAVSLAGHNSKVNAASIPFKIIQTFQISTVSILLTASCGGPWLELNQFHDLTVSQSESG